MTDRYAQFCADLLRAVERLDEVASQPETPDESTARIVRDALIQRFEFTFELAWKTMQRYLIAQGVEEASSPRSTLRLAVRERLIDGDAEAAAWIAMLEDRNATSHAYREALADEVAASIRTAHAPRLRALAARLGALDPDA